MNHKDWKEYNSSEDSEECESSQDSIRSFEHSQGSVRSFEKIEKITTESFFEDLSKVQNKDGFLTFIRGGMDQTVEDENTKKMLSGLFESLHSVIDDSAIKGMRDLVIICEKGKKEGKTQQEMTLEFLDTLEKS